MHGLMGWLTDPSEFDPLLFILLVALTILLTLGSIIWLVLEREDPSIQRGTSDDTSTEAPSSLTRMVTRSEQEAERVQRELDADSGRGPDARGGARG